jgi:hypothetical protein
MCTIITVSRAFWEMNRTAVLTQLVADSIGNGEGWNLILVGACPSDAMSLSSMTIDPLIKFLTTHDGWSRMFLHARAATTTTVNLQGCHGFHGGNGWLVQHNGILKSSRADTYPVDSMLIADVLDTTGDVHLTIDWLQTHEDYANVFFINPELGAYHVMRCKEDRGTLHTDGQGNYSSRPFAAITQKVVGYHSERYLMDYPADEVPTTQHIFEEWIYAHSWELGDMPHDLQDQLTLEQEMWYSSIVLCSEDGPMALRGT